MKTSHDITAAIGNTPLIRLRKASELTGCTILGKAEFMNPGQSVKDRAALFIIKDAIARGALKPGGIVVEGTAGAQALRVVDGRDLALRLGRQLLEQVAPAGGLRAAAGRGWLRA